MPAPTALRRITGWLIDYVIVMVPGVTIVGFGLAGVVNGLAGSAGATAAETALDLVTGSGAALGKTASSFWSSVTSPLLATILVVPLLQFLYLSAMLSWRGRTVGKMIADTTVVTAAAGHPRLRAGRATGRAFCTTLLETGLLGIAFVLLITGPRIVGLSLWAAAIVAFWFNLLSALGARRRTLVDLVTGTAVVRTTVYADAAARAAVLARRTSDAAVTAARRTSEAATVAGHWSADAAAVAAQMAYEGTARLAASAPVQQTVTGAGQAAAQAAQLARDSAAMLARSAPVHQVKAKTADLAASVTQSAKDGADRLARSAPMQQALNSQAGQQVQALGAAGAQRARELGGQTADRARQVGGRAQQLWRDRRARRNGLPQAVTPAPLEGEWAEIFEEPDPAALADGPTGSRPTAAPQAAFDPTPSPWPDERGII
ncbi:RDD family protein [Catellatospora vulcania]|uniref:RDD family protein n=1 Tax=Catellatospora vulcania TaxID=1460450 RepID=UPI0018AFDFA3|nr:RDD family protein [Catellatospora vulcania]